jgi:hypothetical protein
MTTENELLLVSLLNALVSGSFAFSMMHYRCSLFFGGHRWMRVQIVNRDGEPIGQEVRLCERCLKTVPLSEAGT